VLILALQLSIELWLTPISDDTIIDASSGFCMPGCVPEQAGER
jgi:hypothetical protein